LLFAIATAFQVKKSSDGDAHQPEKDWRGFKEIKCVAWQRFSEINERMLFIKFTKTSNNAGPRAFFKQSNLHSNNDLTADRGCELKTKPMRFLHKYFAFLWPAVLPHKNVSCVFLSWNDRESRELVQMQKEEF